MMVKFLRFLFSIYGFAIFLALMFLLFPFIVIASFFGSIRGGNFIYKICRLWADLALVTWGIQHRNIFLAPKNPHKAVIFVFNHTSYMDIPLLLKAFRKQPIRILGKDGMAKIPIFGFIYRKAVVMVNRTSSEARTKSVSRLKAVLRQNISIVLAPEGTFNMTGEPLKSFYNGAFRIAIETQTDIQPVLFLDAYDRLSSKSIFSLNPGRSRAVFLPFIKVDEDNLVNEENLKELVFKTMEAQLIAYKASWIKN